MKKSVYLGILSICLSSLAARAQEFHLEAVCTVNQADASGGSSKNLVANKTLSLEIGSGASGAQSIGVFEGLEFRISSPISISVPYVTIEAKGAGHKVQAGREIGSANSNLQTLAIDLPKAGTLSAICNFSLH